MTEFFEYEKVDQKILAIANAIFNGLLAKKFWGFF